MTLHAVDTPDFDVGLLIRNLGKDRKESLDFDGELWSWDKVGKIEESLLVMLVLHDLIVSLELVSRVHYLMAKTYENKLTDRIRALAKLRRHEKHRRYRFRMYLFIRWIRRHSRMDLS